MSCNEETEQKTTPNQKIEEHFLNHRTIFIFSDINDKVAEEVVKKILYLDSISHDDIKLIINSPGGVISSGMAMLDVMELVKSDIVTIVTGHAASMGAALQCCGKNGKRYAWPSARIMIHQPLINGTFRGTSSEIESEAEQITMMRERLNRLIAERTGQTYEKVSEDTDRDYWMSAEEALEYGMIDHVGNP